MSSLTSHLEGGYFATAKLTPGPFPSFGDCSRPMRGSHGPTLRNYRAAQGFAGRLGQEQPRASGRTRRITLSKVELSTTE